MKSKFPENIRTTVDQIAYATSEKDARTMLMGVNFRSDGKRIITAATDSYRMALNYIDGEFSQNFNVTCSSSCFTGSSPYF